MIANFEIVSRSHGDCWKHKTQNYWVVSYKTAKEAGKPSFLAYRPVSENRHRRDPWTVNNRCVGAFYTLHEAMANVDT